MDGVLANHTFARSFGAQMVIDVLSPEELARHERAINKIRRKLFASHTPEEFGIVPGSEEILTASAENLWNAGVGSYRRITLSGFDTSSRRAPRNLR
jgi:hypothetical protein